MANTVRRSQGDTQSRVVVNLNTRRTIPHIHYVALSQVTTIEGLYVTDFCESKISIDPKVVQEMQLLRNEYKLDLCFTPLYMLANTDLKICYLNARSLHKHIEDVQKDIIYQPTLQFSQKRDLVNMILMKCMHEMYPYLEMMKLQMSIVHIMEQLFITGFEC